MKSFKQKILAKKIDKEINKTEGIVVVDEVSCDGCGDCVDACPFYAIEIKTLSDEEVKQLPFKGRLKVKIKGKNKAFIDTDLCTSCGLCIKQCHEFSIHKMKS